MLHLIAALALACPPSHDGFVNRATPSGPCLTAEPNPEGPHTFAVTSSCGPGRLQGPTGAEACAGCAVDVVVDAATVVTLDLSTLPDGEDADLEYTFTPDGGAPETLAISAIGPEYNDCGTGTGDTKSTGDTADTGADDAGDGAKDERGCDHAGGTPGLAVLLALGLLRRRGAPCST